VIDVPENTMTAWNQVDWVTEKALPLMLFGTVKGFCPYKWIFVALPSIWNIKNVFCPAIDKNVWFPDTPTARGLSHAHTVKPDAVEREIPVVYVR
jgi:hypothetical protein